MKEEGNMGFGFGREGSWVVWKRKVLGLEEKPFAGTGKRRKKEIWVLGLEEKGHGWFGRR